MSAPIPLWRHLRPEEILAAPCYDSLHFLGSYWPGAYDAQSRLVKHFKAPGEPLKTALAAAYAEMIAEIARPAAPDAVVRVLTSGEKLADTEFPLSLVARRVSRMLRIPTADDLFFRTDERKPMRFVNRLSGSEALRSRVSYVLQGLMIRPCRAGPRILLIDDIYNLGATVRIYSAALKQFCEAQYVLSVNLAVTRFAGGRDGHGTLNLDVERFCSYARRHVRRAERKRWGGDPFEAGWATEDAAILHAAQDCPFIRAGETRRMIRLLLGQKSYRCTHCCRRTWLQCLSWLSIGKSP